MKIIQVVPLKATLWKEKSGVPWTRETAIDETIYVRGHVKRQEKFTCR